MSTMQTTPSTSGEGTGGETMERAKVAGHIAAGEASGMKDELSAQTRRVFGDARHELTTQAQERSDRLAETMRTLATRVQAMADGRTAEAGPLPDFARNAASQASRFAESLGSRDIEGVLDDLRMQARRRPGMFLVGAGLAGVMVGRLARSMREAEHEHAAQNRSWSAGSSGTRSQPSYAAASAYGEPGSATGAPKSYGSSTAETWETTR